jgi:hypothetical protein
MSRIFLRITHLEALQPHRGGNISDFALCCHLPACAAVVRLLIQSADERRMEFLAYGDDDSENEKAEDQQNDRGELELQFVNQIQKRWADESDESSSEEEIKIERKRIADQKANSGLISVAELLDKEIQSPSYLRSSEIQEFQVEITAPK